MLMYHSISALRIAVKSTLNVQPHACKRLHYMSVHGMHVMSCRCGNARRMWMSVFKLRVHKHGVILHIQSGQISDNSFHSHLLGPGEQSQKLAVASPPLHPHNSIKQHSIHRPLPTQTNQGENDNLQWLDDKHIYVIASYKVVVRGFSKPR